MNCESLDVPLGAFLFRDEGLPHTLLITSGWLEDENEPPRPRTLGQADEPLSTCAPARRPIDTRHGGRIYRWTHCWRVAFHAWKQLVDVNGVRRWQDSFGFPFEWDCKDRAAIVAIASVAFPIRHGCGYALAATFSAMLLALTPASVGEDWDE